MRKKSFYIILSLFSIIIGGLVYALFRENSIVANFFEHYVHLSALNIDYSRFDSIFLKYYFVDFLWAFSFICGLQAIVLPQNKTHITSTLVIATGFLWETFQFFKLIPGTGDLVDCLMYLTAVLTVVLINNYLKEKET